MVWGTVVVVNSSSITKEYCKLSQSESEYVDMTQYPVPGV